MSAQEPTATASESAPPRARRHWESPDSGAHYRGRRWRSPRAADRDPRAVRQLLARFGSQPSPGGILDVPCGTGRLRPSLERPGRDHEGASGYVGLDCSAAMLAECPGERRVQGSVFALPFRTGSFDVVACCRLLHHLESERDLVAALRELLRVSRRLVVASFWDASSWLALRRRLGLSRNRDELRVARARADLRRTAREAGGEVVAFRHGLRFVTQQTFAVIAKR